MEKQIHTALVTTYPHMPKTQQHKENDWINKQSNWSNESKRQTMQYLLSRNLQKRLEQLTNRTKNKHKKFPSEKSATYG